MTELKPAARALLEERPTYAVATAGEHPWVATMYFYMEADGALVSAIKSDSRTLEALKSRREVAFCVNGPAPDCFLQGLGEGEDIGWLQDHPEVRQALIAKEASIQKFLDGVPKLRVLRIRPTALFLTDHRERISPRERL